MPEAIDDFEERLWKEKALLKPIEITRVINRWETTFNHADEEITVRVMIYETASDRSIPNVRYVLWHSGSPTYMSQGGIVK